MAVIWRVDELAERKGWNARRLAEKAGVDIKTARNILTGRATRVDLDTDVPPDLDTMEDYRRMKGQ